MGDDYVDYDVVYTVVDQSRIRLPKNAIPLGMKEREKFTRDEFSRTIIEKELIVIYLEPKKGT